MYAIFVLDLKILEWTTIEEAGHRSLGFLDQVLCAGE